MEYKEKLIQFAENHKYPLLFATVSGAHLYGFPSPDSDCDLRGVHCLPITSIVGLSVHDETIEESFFEDGFEMDIVSHDVAKFIKMMLKRNGYVLEQLLSPLIIKSSSWHQQLIELADGCLTKNHAHHYLGFSRNQWEMLNKEQAPRIKPLLYLYRVLLTGIHLMQTGELEANLKELNKNFQLSFLDEFIQAKIEGSENSLAHSIDLTFHESQFIQLQEKLEQCRDQSDLPESPSLRTMDELNHILVQIRLESLNS